MKKIGILFMLILIAFILSGCGGGGGGILGGGSSDNLISSGNSGSMKFTIHWPQTGKSAVLASAYSIKISVCVPTTSSSSGGATSSDGASARDTDATTTSYDRVVNAIAIRHNTNNSTDSVSINGVPVGFKTVIVQAYNASGSETGYGTQTVTIVKGSNDGVTVTLAEGVFPYTITSALDAQVPTESTTYPNINTIYPVGGPVDTTVTISGTSFGDYTSASVVKFTTPGSQNWTSITPVTWSSDTITFKIPESAAIGQILVKIYTGTQYSGNVYFNVTSTSSGPQITNLTPITVTAGANFTITGTRFGSSMAGSSNVYFGTLTVTNITSWSDTQIICQAPAGVANGYLKVAVNGIYSNAVWYNVSGSGGLQWQAVSGFPGGNLPLNGVWMTDTPYRVYVAGGSGSTGAIYSYNGSNWLPITFPGTTPSFICLYRGIFGFDDETDNSRVYAVGQNANGAQIVSGGLNTTQWSVNSPAAFPLTSPWPYPSSYFNPKELWVENQNNLFVVGANTLSPSRGIIGIYSGAWNPNPVYDGNLAGILNDIWISTNIGNDIGFVVGPNGYTRKYDMGNWQASSQIAGNPSLYGVWGNADGTIFYAAGTNKSIYRYAAYTGLWTQMTVPAEVPSGVTFNSVWGSSENNVFAVGTGGTIIHYDGTSWTKMTSSTTNNLLSVFGVVGGDVIAVGANGTVIRCQNGGVN